MTEQYKSDFRERTRYNLRCVILQEFLRTCNLEEQPDLILQTMVLRQMVEDDFKAVRERLYEGEQKLRDEFPPELSRMVDSLGIKEPI